MGVHIGLDVSLKRTEVCVVDNEGRIFWRGIANTQPEIIAARIERWRERIVRAGLAGGAC
jgi:transposase